MSILFTVNVLGLSGLKTNNRYLLLPWLIIYLIGFLSCYVAVIADFYYTLDILNRDIIGLIFTGILFNIIWTVVYRTFNAINGETNISNIQ